MAAQNTPTKEEWDSAAPATPAAKAVSKDEWAAATPTKEEWDSATPTGTDVSAPQAFTIGLGKGLTDVGTGALQRVLEGGEFLRDILGLESNQENIDNLKKLIEENRRVFKPLADSSTSAKVGEFIGNTAPAVPIPGGATGGLLRRGLSSAASGAVTGAIQPTTGNESAVANAAIGAVTGGGTSLATSGIGKTINALRGKIPDNEVEKLSKRFGIRTTFGEATDNPITQKAETWLEGVPIIGLKGFREKQQKEAESAVFDFFSKYVSDKTLPDTAAMKEANERALSDIFGKLRGLGKALPEVEANETKKKAAELLTRYKPVFESIQDGEVKRILKDITGDVADKNINTGLVDASGKAIVRSETPKFDFDTLWMLRKGLGKEIGDARTQTASGELKGLYAAVSDDMDEMFSKSNNSIGTMFQDANNEFKRLNLKFDVLRQAYDKATGTTKGGETFSPKRFSTELKNLANDPKYKKNIKWSPNEIEEMNGLAKILETVKRAGQFKENPPTGNRWGLPVLAAMTAPVSLTAAAGEVGVVGMARLLTGTSGGKNLLLAASKVEMNSPAMRSIMNVVYNQAPKWAASKATGD